jgi:hypothetical protein
MSGLGPSLRISRVALYSGLLALLLGAGIELRSLLQRDECMRYLAGDSTAPETQTVVSGTREIAVPCTDWVDRQPETMQLLCLLDVMLFFVFALNAAADVRAWMQMRRRRRAI